MNFIHLFSIYLSTVSIARCMQFSDRILSVYYSYLHEDEDIIEHDLVKILHNVSSRSNEE
jgi:hypothetical protein